MHNKKHRLLAIDPGSREMGIAVLDETQLVYYGVKSLKKFRPQKVLQHAVSDILTRLVIEYGVGSIVIEDGHFSQIASSLYNAALEAMIDLAKQKKLNVVTYNPKTIRKYVCGDGKATKRRTAQILARRYPELEIYLEQNYRWKENYWMNAFDALALGLTHILKTEEESRR
jgi:Holliday junction resolvasome RuvABC endonuclease subunit